MIKLAFGLPGQSIDNPIIKPELRGNLGSLVSSFLNVAIIFAGILLLIWLIIGAFEWMTSEGDKEKLTKARSRMVSAIVGFIIIILAFTLQAYIKDVLNPQSNSIMNVSIP